MFIPVPESDSEPEPESESESHGSETAPRVQPTRSFLPSSRSRPAWPRHRVWPVRLGLGSSAGQATAEYALVLLAAAGLAGLLLAWATSTDGVARLMDAVLDSLIGDVQQ